MGWASRRTRRWVAGLLPAAALAGGGAASGDASESAVALPADCTPVESFDAFRDALRIAKVRWGGPRRKTGVGRGTLEMAIAAGLQPDHRVLDVGAGSLRVGWWLIRYVGAENYHAIEPNRPVIEAALRLMCEEPHVYDNDDFEFPEVAFDFVVARSIWTHASKPMIAKMLSEFVEVAAPDGKFLTSVMLATTPEEDYRGTAWVGRSHESEETGIVRHSLEWIRAECEKNGLQLSVGDRLYQQTWLLIERDGSR